MSTPELFQFRVSHFNEKARWALDYKGIEHVRHCLVPGPHKLRIKKLTGQEQVPVLRMNGDIVVGSNAIIDTLETRQPEPALYPRDPATKQRALEIQARFDAGVGPAIRLAMFHELLVDPGYFTSLFTWDQSALVRIGYRAIFPAVRVLMSREMKITPENAERALEVDARRLRLRRERKRRHRLPRRRSLQRRRPCGSVAARARRGDGPFTFLIPEAFPALARNLVGALARASRHTLGARHLRAASGQEL